MGQPQQPQPPRSPSFGGVGQVWPGGRPDKMTLEEYPIAYVLRYLALGEGDTAPVTREVLRKAIRNPLERPRIHVG